MVPAASGWPTASAWRWRGCCWCGISAGSARIWKAETRKEKSPLARAFELAEWTGLEPATPGVTGRYSNRLNYHSLVGCRLKLALEATCWTSDYALLLWRPLGDSNPCTHRERVMS
ncbi:conserved hypothetical protein [Cupriavidus taiwanensis]|uniref:Transposase n=1 Tax=Cupriavidus taiwanensis TaxID=164546 RepID=A0A975ZYW2_9BURK|nr:conserved hypothetical protein [Cupriavidus taiwanensis]